MIVGRGEVKALLFDKELHTIETAKKVLKESKYLYPTIISTKQEIVESMKAYKKRKKTVRRCLKCPDEVDDLKISFDEKYIIFEFDPTVGDNDLVIYPYCNFDGGDYYYLVSLLPLIN